MKGKQNLANKICFNCTGSNSNVLSVSSQARAIHSKAVVTEGRGAHDCMAGKGKQTCVLVSPYGLHPEFVCRQTQGLCTYEQPSSQISPFGQKVEQAVGGLARGGRPQSTDVHIMKWVNVGVRAVLYRKAPRDHVCLDVQGKVYIVCEDIGAPWTKMKSWLLH